ncbi:zinc finger protein 362b isoform X5 [Salvelinus fontinalis]|uniref:zinc finger protein 362b isoform X5 n=1 Tax=Salvelinus fontinalis TaxID=8038 RepID=UPI0024857334|nr:zinc finger protein 362b isoform X5 [Salvelinus fontinalis]
MAEPRFNNPYFWPPPPSMPGQLDNLVLINKIKEQLMAEKIRPLHLPTNSAPSQQTLLVASSPLDGGQHSMLMPKPQQGQHHPQGSVQQPDIALHARTASSSVPEVMDDKSAVKVKGLWDEWHMRQIVEQPSRVNHRSVFMCPYTGLAPMSRLDSHSTSEALTPTSSSQNRLGGTPSINIISGLASGPGMEQIKSGGLAGLLGPPPKTPRGRKKIKAESGGPLLVVPYPIMASGADLGCVTFPAKEGKTYSQRCRSTPSPTRRPSPTSVPTAPSPLPTHPTWPSTSASTWESSPTTAPTARTPSANSRTCSSTPESILVTDPINARPLDVKRPLPSSLTSSPTRGSTTKTSRTNVPTATVPTQIQHRYRSTCQRTPSKMLRRTAATCVAGHTPQRPTL